MSPTLNERGVYAVAVQEARGFWFVYWETTSAFGSQGGRMTREQADELAAKIRSGEVSP